MLNSSPNYIAENLFKHEKKIFFVLILIIAGAFKLAIYYDKSEFSETKPLKSEWPIIDSSILKKYSNCESVIVNYQSGEISFLIKNVTHSYNIKDMDLREKEWSYAYHILNNDRTQSIIEEQFFYPKTSIINRREREDADINTNNGSNPTGLGFDLDDYIYSRLDTIPIDSYENILIKKHQKWYRLAFKEELAIFEKRKVYQLPPSWGTSMRNNYNNQFFVFRGHGTPYSEEISSYLNKRVIKLINSNKSIYKTFKVYDYRNSKINSPKDLKKYFIPGLNSEQVKEFSNDCYIQFNFNNNLIFFELYDNLDYDEKYSESTYSKIESFLNSLNALKTYHTITLPKKIEKEELEAKLLELNKKKDKLKNRKLIN